MIIKVEFIIIIYAVGIIKIPKKKKKKATHNHLHQTK